MAGLFVVTGPSLLSWGARRAYGADQRLLQEAVAAYRAAPPALRSWPTLSGRAGEPVEGTLKEYQCDGSDRTEVCPWLDIEALAKAGFLPSGAESIGSADSTRNVTAANAPSGRYGWYVDAEGLVKSQPPFSRETGYP